MHFAAFVFTKRVWVSDRHFCVSMSTAAWHSAVC